MKKVVRAIIVNEKSEVLLGKKTEGIGAGLYGLIGGKPDKNETDLDAIKREVKEETGLDFNPTFYQVKNQNDWLVSYFIGEATGELKLDTQEVTHAAFFTEDGLLKMNIAFDQKGTIIDFLHSQKIPANKF